MILFKRRAIITLLALLYFTAYSYSQISKPGIFKIKIAESHQHIIGSLNATSSNQLMSSDPSLNGLLQKYPVKKVQRLFPYAGKFEEKHRKHGLHLWYSVEINSESMAVLDNCIKDFKDKTFIQHSEPFIEYTLNDIKPTGGNTNDGERLTATTNDPLFQYQWHYQNTGQSGGTNGADISLLDAWDIQTGSSDVIVAIVDGGLDPQHEDLEAAMWVNDAEMNGISGQDDDNNGFIDDIYGYNFVNGNGNISPHYHGVHVGGTVGAVNNNGIGLSGVAGGNSSEGGVRLMSCQVFTNYGSGGMENAYVYAADNGAVISQNSWGYISPGYFDQAVLDAIDYFIEEAGYDEHGDPIGPMQGGIVIFAAGNDGVDDDYYPGYYDPVVAVASLDHNDRRSYFSNYGDWVDIAAPGSDVYSTYLNDSYDYMSGTSMACPHVSGVAALIVSQFPGIAPSEVRARLIDFTDNIDTLNTGFEGKLGSGRVNAFQSLLDPDTIPPAAISDLAVDLLYYNKVNLSWTATGASGNEGKAYQYDMRLSNLPITEMNFDDAQTITVSKPKSSGEQEIFTIENLSAFSNYYVAIKVKDYYGNTSEISNVTNFTTPGPPDIRIEPLVFKDTLYTGGQKTNYLTIYNDGESVLDVFIDHSEFKSSSPSQINRRAETRFTFEGGKASSVDPENNEIHDITFGPLSTELKDLTGFKIAVYNYGSYTYFTEELQTRGANITYISSLETEGFDVLITDDNIRYLNSQEIDELRTWLMNGGGLFLLTDEAILQANSLLDGVGIELYTSSSFYGYLNDISEHAVTANVTSIYSSSHGAFINIEAPAEVIARTEDEEIAAAASILGRGKVMVFGNEFISGSYFYQADNRIFSHNVIDWLSEKQNWLRVTPESQSILSGDSYTFEIDIDATRLSDGDYRSNISVLSNDPVDDSVGVSQLLHIYKAPDIKVSVDTIDYENVFAGYSYFQTVEIINIGLEPLNISDIYTDNTYFTPDTTRLILHPNEKYQLKVALQSPSAANLKNSLFFQSNDPDEDIYSLALIAEVLSPPNIEVTPDSMASELLTGGREIKILTVDNSSGNSDLYVKYDLGSKLVNADTREILNNLEKKVNAASHEKDYGTPIVEIQSGASESHKGFIAKISKNDTHSNLPDIGVLAADDSYYAEDVVDKLISTGRFHSVTFVDMRSYTPTLEELLLFDAVLVYSNYSYYDNDALGDVLAEYFDMGGGVVNSLFDVGGSGSYTLGGRWLEEEYYIIEKPTSTNSYYRSYLGNIIDPLHPIVQGVDDFDGGYASFKLDEDNQLPGGQTIASWDDGIPLVLSREKNSLNLIELGFFPPSSDAYYDFWNSSTDGDLLMANALIYSIEGGRDWLTLGSAADTIPAGSKKELEVTFDAYGLRGGQYDAYINITSNDPATPLMRVPAHLSVTNSPDLISEGDSILFKEVFITETRLDSILLSNKGYDTLFITDYHLYENSFTLIDTLSHIAPGASVHLKVSFHPEEDVSYGGVLSIHSNDPYESSKQVYLKGVGIHPPVMELSTDTLVVYAPPGSDQEGTLNIVNSGSSTLDWEVVSPRLYSPGDDIGYTWIDSNEPGGPVFQWEDISSTGTAIYLYDDDYEYINLPFDFDFFDQTYNYTYISSNGFLGFSVDGIYSYSNQGIPSTVNPNAFLAGFWDDLFPSGNDIYYKAENDQLIVQYNNINSCTFQIILRSNGDILYKYLDMRGYTSSATVGLENQNGTKGLEIAYNEQYISDSLTVLIRNGKSLIKNIDPQFGEIQAGGEQELTITVNSKELEIGTENEELILIETNDPHNKLVTVPLKVIVLDPPTFVDSYIGMMEVSEGNKLVYDFDVFKENYYTNLEFSVTEHIENVTIDGDGLFEFTPNFDQAGQYEFYVKATSENYSDSLLITVNVLNTNRAPKLMTEIHDQEFAIKNVSYSLDLSAHIADPDGDKIIFSFTSSDPDALSTYINGSKIHFMPKEEEIVTITLKAEDGHGGALLEQFLVNSFISNLPPEVAIPMSDMDIPINADPLVFNLAEYFVDHDNDPLSYSLLLENDVIEYTMIGTVLTISPVELGDSEITITATDPKGNIAEITFVIRVGEITSSDIFDKNFKFFPNPTSGKVSLEVDKLVKVRLLKVVNEIGEVVYIQEFQQAEMVDNLYQFDLSGNATGVYIMLIQTDNNIIQHKLILR